MFGPDSSSSLDPSQIDELQRIIQNINYLRNNPINKDKVSGKINRFKRIFGKSVALKRSLKKGNIIKKSDLTLKKPGNGISYMNIKKVIGKKLKRDVSHQYLLRVKDFN
jgi:N,N'-diacetyllegionaminate synthase